MARTSARYIALACVLLALAGCGKKGPLYLPDETGEVVTRPADTTPASENTEAPNSPKTIDSEPRPPAPAPEVTPPEDPKKDSKKGEGATPPQQK